MHTNGNQLNIVDEISMIEYTQKDKENENSLPNSEKNSDNSDALNLLDWQNALTDSDNLD